MSSKRSKTIRLRKGIYMGIFHAAYSVNQPWISSKEKQETGNRKQKRKRKIKGIMVSFGYTLAVRRGTSLGF